MRCLGCKAYKEGKCTAGVTPYKSKLESDGVGCRLNRKSVEKRLREQGENK